jgi:hypothetical protein
VRAKAGITNVDEIGALLADPNRRAEMGRNGKHLVETTFTWPRVAAAMEDAYRCSMK